MLELLKGTKIIFLAHYILNINMEMVAIEKVRSPDPWIRLAREKLLIRTFDATLNKIM